MVKKTSPSNQSADQLPRDDAGAQSDQLATDRVAELEHELFLTRAKAADAIADLEDQVGWMHANELNLRPWAEQHAWVATLLRVWVFAVRGRRRLRRFLRK